MGKYSCQVATLDDIIKKYNYEIAHAIDDKNNWIIWKEKAIENYNKGLSITYIGLLDNKIICECTAAIDPSIVQNSIGLVDRKTAYLFAFRTNEEYQGQGYFSKLFKFMLDDLKLKGYEEVTLGVESGKEKNKTIYFKYGFTKHIKNAQEVYPDGTTIDVEYYSKKI